MSIQRAIINNPSYHIVNVKNVTSSPSFKLLHEHICVDAYTKSGVYDDMKCYPGTRELILERLENWVAAPGNADRLITWLDGPMGAGKTAVAVTMAERTATDNKLIGSFIFRRGHPGRDDEIRFVATLAYQMALSIPLVRPFIEEAISHDPAILQQSLSRQLDALILDPLRKLRSQHPDIDVATLPNLIIVDGLDECGAELKAAEGGGKSKGQLETGREVQQLRVLDLLYHLVLAQDILPFSILVHSRPEKHIKDWFRMEKHSKITNRFTLDASYTPTGDIQLFTTHAFLKILETHPSRHFLTPNWPHDLTSSIVWSHPILRPRSVIEIIVERSAGQFLYASVLMKYIASKHHRPDKRLLSILEGCPTTPDSPHTSIDALYTQILDNTDDHQTVRDILALNQILTSDQSLVFVDNGPRKTLIPVTRYLSVLSISRHDLDHCLEQLEAILTLRMNPFIKFHHWSFGQFLRDPERSKNWYIGDVEYASYFALRAFDLFSNELYVGAQKSYLKLLRATLDYMASAVYSGQPLCDYAVMEELEGFCNFTQSSYFAPVMRFARSSLTGLTMIISTMNDVIRQMDRFRSSQIRIQQLSQGFSWMEARKIGHRRLEDMWTFNIQTLIEPHVIPFLASPSLFSLFLCWVYNINVPDSEFDAYVDRAVPSPDALPCGVGDLFIFLNATAPSPLKIAGSCSAVIVLLKEIFSIPSIDFLKEAYLIALNDADRPSSRRAMSRSPGSNPMAEHTAFLLYHFDISQELWMTILDCDEYFTPHFRHRLQASYAEPVPWTRYRRLYQDCPDEDSRMPVQPFDIALATSRWVPPPSEDPYESWNRPYPDEWFLKNREYQSRQILIPTVPLLARYLVYCKGRSVDVPVPISIIAQCPCGRMCFKDFPVWMRSDE